MVLHHTVLGVVEAILSPHCSRYQLNLTQGIRICPGEVEQMLHRDDELLPYKHGGLECMVNALWAYDDFTEANKATQGAPGSHKQDLDREPPSDRVEPAVMPRGSVLLFRGSVIHGAVPTGATIREPP